MSVPRDRPQTAPGSEPLGGAEEQHRLLMESVTDYAIFLLDPAGRVAAWNAGAARILGYREEEILGQPLGHLFTPDDVQRGEPERELAAATATGRASDDRWLVRKDGTHVWVSGVTTALRDPHGGLRGFAKVLRDRTEKRQAEEARRESERFFRSTIDALPAHVCVVDEHGTVLAVNRAWREFARATSTAPGTVCEGANYLTACDSAQGEAAANAQAVAAGVRAVLAGEQELFTLEYPAQGPTGRRWFLARVSRFVSEGPARAVVTHEDITARQEAEERLRYQLQLLDTIASRAAEALFLMDTRGHVHYLNPAAQEMFGWPLADLAGRSLHEAIHYRRPDGTPYPPRECPLGRVMVSGRTVHNHADIFYRRDGSAVHVRCSTAPVIEAGRLTGAVLVVSDVTESRRVRERHTNQLRQLARVALIVNAVHDLDSLLGVITEEARQLVGAHQGAISLLLDQDWAHALHQISLSDRYAAWRSSGARPEGSGLDALVCRTNQPLRLTQAQLEAHPEYRRFEVEASRYPSRRGWLAAPLVARDGRNMGLVQLSDKDEGDFTENDEAMLVQLAQVASVAIENARLYQQLREADRHKDEWLSLLAHELRTPLAPALNSLHLLQLAGDDPLVAGQARGMLERQVRHLARLIEDLLEVTRLIHGQIQLRRERLDLGRLVRTVSEDYRRLLEQAGLTLSVVVPQVPVWVAGDGARLTQVLGNLLDNAGKFTERGGRVAVRLQVGSGGGEGAGECAELTVRDTGIGIEAELLPVLFDVFAQADRSLDRKRGGLGLGLSLVRGLVTMHGGEVSASSAGPGRGAEFTVRLPLEQEPAALKALPAALGPAGMRQRILIIEDNRDAANSLRMVLELMGHEVRVAYSGPEGVQAATEWNPDTVLSDIGLPGLDGFGVARELRRNPATARTRLIAVTGYGQDSDRQLSREVGFEAHLTKPVEPEVLMQVLAEAGPGEQGV